MAEYLAPGTYIEELRSAVVPIQGVSTSTAGFVGRTERGPDVPLLVTSWPEYTRWFGGHVNTAQSYLPFAVQGFFANGGQRLFIARVNGAGATAATLAQPFGAGPGLVATAIGTGEWGNRISLTLLRSRKEPARTGSTDPEPPPADRFRLRVAYLDPGNGEITEEYDDLAVDPLAPRAAIATVNAASHLITLHWQDPGLSPVLPELPDDGAPPVALSAGSDGASITAADYLGDPGAALDAQRGLAALEAIDQISILAIPDAVGPLTAVELPVRTPDAAPVPEGPEVPEVPEGPEAGPVSEAERVADSDASGTSTADQSGAVVEGLLEQCERLKDRMAILDVGKGQGDVAGIAGGYLSRRSDYAAIYYPFIRVLDPLTGEPVLVPPSGHIAGVYAFNDVTRGVHKAPANYELRGILSRNVTPTQGPLEFTVTKGQQDILNPQGVNVLRDFRASGQGVRVWGARTISADPGWIYVNVRRLFIFVEESIDEALQWVVFEPNDEPTWARVRQSISVFLERVWRDGGLMGTTPSQAFFVRCDRTTMSTDDILNGRLICLVGLAAVRPAEFVILRFSQITIEATT